MSRSTTQRLLLRASHDGGMSFGASTLLRDPADFNPFANLFEIRLAALARNVFAVWPDSKFDPAAGTFTSGLFLKASNDSGNMFGGPINVGSSGEGGIQIAAAGDGVYLLWSGRSDGIANRGIVFRRFGPVEQPGSTRDTSPPLVDALLSLAPNAAGWHNKDVTVSWTMVDPESPITSSSGCQTRTIREETTNTTLTCSATNAAGLSATRSITIRLDKTPPEITPFRMRQPNAAGWYKTDVTVDFLCSDQQSGVENCPAPQTLRSEGVNQSLTATAVDIAGNLASVTVSGVNIDKTPPTITGTRTPSPNTNGWNNTNVAVSFACSDGLSGLAAGSPPTDTVLSSEGAAQSVSGTCADLAGNSASATVSNINIDKTPPVITGSRTPLPNSAGWNNSSVTVNFACSDSLSGIATCGPGSQLVTSEGTNQSRSASAVDLAGNTASATVNGISIDKTPPTLACSATPNVVWPPDHKLVNVSTAVNLTDSLSGSAGFLLQSTTSNEPDDGLGDGDTANDIQGWDIGTPDISGWLRAERSGLGSGRVYSLAYRGTDKAGNTANCATMVSVPHDQR